MKSLSHAIQCFQNFFARIQPEVKEGSVIELTVTPPDGEPLKANIKVQAEDMELLQMIKNMQQK